MNVTNDERIEKYLLNTMTESEKSAFQLELMQNQDLREEMKTLRRLQKALRAHDAGQEGNSISILLNES